MLLTDGGGRAKAALRPIVGADKAARFLIAVSAGLSQPGLRVRLVDVNGAPGVLVESDSGPLIAVSLVVADGRVEQPLVVLNPDKLAGMRG